MPLLMCPNDDAPMKTVTRGGVEFDMCPTCRGVWLDRGELEKLMALGSEINGAPSSPAPWGQDQRPPPRHDDHPFAQAKRYEEPKRWHDDRYDKDGRPRKKKDGFDLFDIFD